MIFQIPVKSLVQIETSRNSDYGPGPRGRDPNIHDIRVRMTGGTQQVPVTHTQPVYLRGCDLLTCDDSSRFWLKYRPQNLRSRPEIGG